MMNEYKKMAEDFCKETNTKITITYKDTVQNPWDATDYTANWWHDVYRVRIDRNHKTYSFNFTASKHATVNGKRPTKYDILACLTKYDPCDFDNFCAEFGYNNDSIKAYKTYKAVQKEYNNVIRLFSDVMERLEEIQ
jgi:hypothetical protein